MTRRLRALVVTSLLTLAGLAAAPAVLAGDPCYHGYSIPPSTTATTTLVRMDPCAFVPTNAQIEPGWTVTFKNPSGEAHLLTGANAAWGDRDQLIAPGAAVTVTFEQPGVYAFSCALHRGMSGAVIVGDPNAAAGAAPVSASSTDGGYGVAAAVTITGLAGLGALGWAIALLQRRRPARGTATSTSNGGVPPVAIG
jgi:plastocyanin